MIYVLSKYLLIHLYQKNNNTMGHKTLQMVIKPMVQREQKREDSRAHWFATGTVFLTMITIILKI